MNVSLILMAVALLALVVTVWYFYARIKRWFRSLFGADNLRELVKERETEAENMPKSLPGATDVYLPVVRKDFPELNWPEFRAGAEKELKKHLTKEGCADILIHRTVLGEYRREKGNCYAVLYSAVQYSLDGKKTQARYSVTMGYVQDADKAGYENGVSLCCPKCGAPVKSLGEKTCAYCGAAIEEINMRVWRCVAVTAK